MQTKQFKNYSKFLHNKYLNKVLTNRKTIEICTIYNDGDMAAKVFDDSNCAYFDYHNKEWKLDNKRSKSNNELEMFFRKNVPSLDDIENEKYIVFENKKNK